MKNIVLRFHPREKYFPVCIHPSRERTPAYISHGTNEDDHPVTTIYFYYAQNPGKAISPTSPTLGWHEHDVEYITLIHGTEDRMKVVFSQHTSREASVLDWKDCEKTPAGDLIVYVARNSHANYPHAGIYWRIFGFGNDYCSSKGCEMVIPLQAMNPSYDFFFPNGIRLTRSVRYPLVPTLSPLQKFFIPLV